MNTRSISNEQSQENDEGITVSSRLLLMIGFGVALVSIGIVIIAIASALSAGGSGGFGAVVFIGPFPIVIGAGPNVTWLILIGIILAVLTVALFLIMNRRIKSVS